MNSIEVKGGPVSVTMCSGIPYWDNKRFNFLIVWTELVLDTSYTFYNSLTFLEALTGIFRGGVFEIRFVWSLETTYKQNFIYIVRADIENGVTIDYEPEKYISRQNICKLTRTPKSLFKSVFFIRKFFNRIKNRILYNIFI